MPDIAKGNIGPETDYDVAFANGGLQVTLSYGGAQMSAKTTLNISAAGLVDALAQKVSNATEKALLVGLEDIIKAIP